MAAGIGREMRGDGNQAPALVDYNLYSRDAALREGLRREGAGWAEDRLEAFGARLGGEEAIRWGFEANTSPPVLRAWDRFGERRDEVEFHPAWHELMRLSVEQGLSGGPWREPREGAHVARAAALYLAGQNEAGHTCPLSMTYAAIPALRQDAAADGEWEPRLKSAEYDARFRPAEGKRGALCGMGMTERQGGSDVRANRSRAELIDGGEYEIWGHKWFCSAPMCDVFLVLAQTAGGLTCFLMPRWRPDGTRNAIRLARIKDKLGNRSNASAEVEFDGAWARRIGGEGRGVATIIEMVNHTRLDCVVGSASLMRQAAAQAAHHARHRWAFGRPLVEQPAMTAVLADLFIEAEAALALGLRVARAFDARERSAGERGLARLGVAAAKYWVTKRAPAMVGEAMECLGGNGYVEECVMPRLYREAPVNSIWEGSGSVVALDVVRAVKRDPGAVEAVMAEAALAQGGDRRLDAFLAGLKERLGRVSEEEARRLAEDLALALAGSLLVRHGDTAVADAFCATRLGREGGWTWGTLPKGTDAAAIVRRGWAD